MFLSTLSYAKYVDLEQFVESDYYVLIGELNKDKKRQNESSIRKKMARIIQHDSNNFTKIYNNYLKTLVEIHYSVGDIENIEGRIGNLIKESSEKKSVVTRLIIEAALVYYKSNNQRFRLLNILRFLNDKTVYLIERERLAFKSSIYYETYQFEKAIEVYEEQMKLDKCLIHKSSMHNNIGLSYKSLEQYEMAEVQFERSIILLQKCIEDSLKIDPNFDRLNYLLYVYENNLLDLLGIDVSKEKQIEDLTRYINWFKKAGHFKPELIYRKAKLFSDIKKYKESNNILDSLGKNIGRNPYLPDIKAKVNGLKVFNNLKLGNTKAVIQNLSENTNYQHFDNLSTNIRVHNFYNKIHKEEKKKQKNNLHSIKDKNKVLSQTLVIIFTLLLFSFLIWILRKKHLEKKVLDFENKLLKVKEESELFLAESNHRIMNNIQLVSDLATIEFLEDKEFDLKSFQHKMNTMADIHELLYKNENQNEISVKNYLSMLIKHLKGFDGEDVSIQILVDKKSALPPEILKYIGILTVEFFMNSIKHGFENTNEKLIIIKFTEKDIKQWRYSYKDNGNFKIKNLNKEERFGNQMISKIISLLGAKYKIEEKYGFLVTIEKHE
jgi:two-component sensor histidine kinase